MITMFCSVIIILDAWDTTPDSDLPPVCSNTGLTGLYSALATVFNAMNNIICCKSINILDNYIL